MTLVYFLILLGVLIFVHELGHFLAARSVGMRVEKFYLGFNLFGIGLKKKWGETEYGIGLFPLGGYVKVSGILDESMDPSSTGADYEYQSKNAFQQIWFASAGVIMNFLLALCIFTGIIYHIGMGIQDERSVVGEVIPDYPAEASGLIADDLILSVNGESVSTWEEMTSLIHPLVNESVILEVEREGSVFFDTLTTISNQTYIDGELKLVGMVGITPKIEIVPASFPQAVKEGASMTVYWLEIIFDSIKMITTGDASFKELGGPIMIAKLTGESVKNGLMSFLNLMAIISINLAFLNILPIPAMDGGHIVIAIIEGISRRKLPAKVKLG
ncbi:MAG: RIP metalloprotease, partial [Fidelibacterota bacterium]